MPPDDQLPDAKYLVVGQVYVVTSGEYSSYHIDSIWLTLEEAERAAPGGYIEVWPIGENPRTLGDFNRSCDLDATTGELKYPEVSGDGAHYDPRSQRASVICWDNNNNIGIRVNQTTQERADKVYSETKARVLAMISTGLPKEAIADERYSNGHWSPIR